MNDNDLIVYPSPMGMLRFPATRGYYTGAGAGLERPCTCTMDCRTNYCTGRDCGCQACALELGQLIMADEEAGIGGFALSYKQAKARYGRNIAKELSPLWADQKVLQQRYRRLAERISPAFEPQTLKLLKAEPFRLAG